MYTYGYACPLRGRTAARILIRMRSLMLSVLVVACGSEPTAFSSVAAHSEPDASSSGGMLATGGTSTGGMRTTNTGGSVATGGAPNVGATGSGGDTSCGPRPICIALDVNLRGTDGMTCTTAADCCHGVPCDTGGYNPGLCHFIGSPPRCTPENVVEDCPCGWLCRQFNDGADGLGPDAGHFCTPPR